MVLSWLDRSLFFDLPCGHPVVLGRLEYQTTWTCEECRETTDLTTEPFKTILAKELETAQDIDNQERNKGSTVTRADG